MRKRRLVLGLPEEKRHCHDASRLRRRKWTYHPHQGHQAQFGMQALKMLAVVLVLVIDDRAGTDGEQGKGKGDEEDLVLFPRFFFQSRAGRRGCRLEGLDR